MKLIVAKLQYGNLIHDFPVTQIIHEINLETLKVDFYEFLHFLKAEIYPNRKFRAPKIAKTALFDFLDPPKLISRKI